MLMLALALVVAEPPTSVPVRVKAVSAEIITAMWLGDPDTHRERTYLLVRAAGEVGSSGWSDCRLVDKGVETARGIGPAPDGYLEFELVAHPPAKDGYHLTVVDRVSAAKLGEIVVVPGMLKGVRVRGRDSVREVKIEGLAAVDRLAKP